MLEESRKLYDELNDGIGSASDTIKAACTEYMMNKIFADFERGMLCQIIPSYGNNRERIKEILKTEDISKHCKLSENNKNFLLKCTADDDIRGLVLGLYNFRNTQSAHSPTLSNPQYAWEQIKTEVFPKVVKFLEDFNAYVNNP